MGNLCVKARHGGDGHGKLRQHSRSGQQQGYASDADASKAPQLSSRGSDQELTRAEVKRQTGKSPLSKQNNEADYPPPIKEGPQRRRSSVKRECAAAGPALRNLGDGDYPPPPVAMGAAKTCKQVKQERDAAPRLSRVNHDL